MHKATLIAGTFGLMLPAVLQTPVVASDHREAPLIREDLTADLADLYAFMNPNDPSKLVMIMTVNGFTAPSENTTFNFSPNVRYSFNIDTNGDALAEHMVSFTFAGPSGPFMAKISDISKFSGEVTLPTLEPGSNAPIITTTPSGMRAFAGQCDDPFFFDVVGFNRFLAGTGGFAGNDGFAGFNVSAIALEIPVAMIDSGSDNLQIWSTTDRRQVTLRLSHVGMLERSFGPWRQVDRVGNPAVNTALVPSDKKDFFNNGQPVDDASDFAGDLVASLQSLGTNEENIGILASVAVPDTLKIDTTMPSAFPNGRTPQDDVIDTLLFFIFNQTPVSDGANMNDVAFPGAFPFLADPHQPG